MNTVPIPSVFLKQFLPLLMKKFVKSKLHIIPKPLLNQMLTLAFNHALEKPLQAGEFDFLTGRWLTIVVEDLDFNWSMTLSHQQFRVDDIKMGHATLSGDSHSLLMIVTQIVDADTLFFQRKLTIEGDTEFALEVKNTLDAVDKSELAPIFSTPLTCLEALLKSQHLTP